MTMWRLRASFGPGVVIETEHATLSEALARVMAMQTNLFNLPQVTRITLVRKGTKWNSAKSPASGNLKDSGMRTYRVRTPETFGGVPITPSMTHGQTPSPTLFDELIPDVKLQPWQREHLDRLMSGLDVWTVTNARPCTCGVAFGTAEPPCVCEPL